MTSFATFGLLYMTALFLELSEQWRYPLFTSAILLLIILIAWVGITRITFLVFLAATTAQFLLFQFPDVANHVNLAIYANILMMSGIIYSLVRRTGNGTDDEFFRMARPLLQVTVILMYFLAGFHKLNTDFFDPAVSCVGVMVSSLTRVATLKVAGVPIGPFLLGGIIGVVYQLLAPRLSRGRRRLAIGLAVAIVSAAFGALMVAGNRLEVTPDGATSLILVMAVLVVTWELAGGPLLAVPALQAPVLAFSLAMHSSLALVGFVDFGAFALAMLFAFVPEPYLGLLKGRAPVLGRHPGVYRIHLYFAMCVLAGVASGLQERLLAGLLFLLGTLLLIWPVLVTLAGPNRPHWTGVPLTTIHTPRWMFIFPVLLILHGFTSYLGLRTAGNFSMFSNLRTEGPVSNHLLLGSNPLKIWGYQEDVIRFIQIDDRTAAIAYQYQPLQGNLLPAVEFRKLVYAWTRAGATIPMTFEYRGEIHSTDDIVNQPAWRTTARNWEMRLMDFRSIQPDRPNRCRW